MQLDFGQPADGVIQMAYTVPDIHAAIDWWVKHLKVGPWFLLENFGGIEPLYRGMPSNARTHAALGFAGHMQIELIQPLDAQPSAFRETIERRGFGFHHFGKACADLGSTARQLASQAFVEVFRCKVPTGGTVIYMDGGPDQAGMIELIEVNPVIDSLFGSFYRASLGWNGTNPVRAFG